MSKSKAFLQKIADQPPPCVTIADPELFFPTSYSDEYRFQIRQAKSVCHRCPFFRTGDCLEFALETGDQHAIMAATTPAERDNIRKRISAREERRAA